MSEAKLTTMQIKEIQEKYAAGMTQKALAEEYGVSQSLIQKRCGGPYRTYNKNPNVVYPAIGKYMKDHGLTNRKLALNAGINYVALYYVLNGKHEPSKSTIDKILAYTGLTYEEAFRGNNG